MSVFVNQIDELIDRSLDQFFKQHVYQNKLFGKLTSEVNFVKYQLNLHTVLDEFILSIDRKALATIVTQAENVQRVVDIIKRYAAYYSLLWVALYYAGKRTEYVNNIVEMGSGQQRSTFRITNFYNSDNNATLFRLYDLIRDIAFVLSIDKPKASILGTPQGVAQYRHALDFIADLPETAQQQLKIKGAAGVHNVIKTLIVMRLYQGEEKTDAIRILQEAELEKGEYTYIDIIVPRVQHFDFSTIEGLLNPKQLRAGIADVIYDTLTELADKREMTVDDKVSILMNSGILVPIVEDFMLVHKDTEKYEREQQTDKRARTDDTRIRYIVSKLDAVAELYSSGTIGNAQRKEHIEKLMYAPMKERAAVLINELEEIKIINKIENQGKQTENMEFYHDLTAYRTYPYVSFKAMQRQGFPYTTTSTVLAVRATNFEFSKALRNAFLDTRAASSLTPINVVGFVIRPLGSGAQCYKVGQVTDIREFTVKSRTSEKVFKSDNGFLGATRFIKQAIIKGKQDGGAMYWMLDVEKDKFDVKGYEPISNSNLQEYLRLMLAHMYDSIQEMVVERTVQDLKKLHDRGEIFSIQEIERYVREVERRTLPMNENTRKTIASVAYNEFYPKGSDAYDLLEDVYPGLDGDLVPILRLDLDEGEQVDNLQIDAHAGLSEDTGDAVKIQARIMSNFPTAGMAADLSIPTTEDDETGAKLLEYISRDVNYQKASCQHILSWQETMQYKRDRDNSQYEEGLFNFIQIFVRKNEDDDYVCKSCDEMLPIKHFVVDGVFDDEQQRFVTFAIPMDTPLQDMREYEKYGRIIRDLDLRISSICEMINLKFYVGHATAIKWRRKTIVKNVLDLLLTHNRILKNNYKKRNETATEMYGIDRKLSNLFFFDIDDSVVDYSSRDKDFFRLVKLNNITAYIIFAILLELNDDQIATLGRDRKARVDKLCTLDFYERVAPTLFDKLYILRSTDGRRVPISSIPNFGYTLFIISCIVARNRRWYMEETDKMAAKAFDPLMQKSIIHTVTDLINSVVEVYALPDENRPWLYTVMGSRFMSHLKTVYESPKLSQRMIELRTPQTAEKKEKKMLPREKNGDLITITGDYFYTQPAPFTQIKSTRLKWFGNISARDVVNHRHVTGNSPLIDVRLDRNTNCPDGKFHKWIPVLDKEMKVLKEGEKDDSVAISDDFVCKRCKQSMEDVSNAGELEEADSIKMLDSVYHNMIGHLSLTVCTNGLEHTYRMKGGKLVCSRCAREREQTASASQIRELEKIISRTHELPKADLEIFQVPKEIVKRAAALRTDAPAIELIAAIQKVLGKDAKLSANRELLSDTYIVERDYIGNRLQKPIVIGSKDGKIKYKTDHPFFKTNVMYYTDENREVDVYYDAISHVYLGFRERNREYVVTDDPHYLKVNWSLKSQIELIGFSGIHMRVMREAAELGITAEILEEIDGFQQFIDLLYRERFSRIYQTIGEIQRIIYTIRNGNVAMNAYNTEGEREEANPDEPDASLTLMQQFSKTLAKIDLGSDDKRIFGQWHDLVSNIPSEDVPAGERPEEWLSAHDLARDDVAGKTALHYMTIELSRLLELNNDKFTASNLVNFITQLIDYVFNMWNQDAVEHEAEIKRFIISLDIRHGFESRSKIAEEETEVMNSDGTGAITDDVPDTQETESEDAEEMTTLGELIEGGAEMEKDEEFISDYSADREAHS